jgi:diguanylate cyclase (GGDEF)-like protein
MEYKYNLTKLQYDKEQIEGLIANQMQRGGQVFPERLEQEFWAKNQERARKHVDKYVWAGVLSYFLFMLVMIPSDFWIVAPENFVKDFIKCLLGLVNGGLCLLVLFCFASVERLRAYFAQASMGLLFWLVLSTSWLTITVSTPALRDQAMAILCIVYILGYILTGIKPLYMFITGVVAAAVTLLSFIWFKVDMNLMVLTRILLGAAALGYVISHMIFARERVIYLYMLRARISEQIHRIHNSELLHLSQHDELTKISNRRTFDEMLDVFYEQTVEKKVPLAVLFIDVDFFKNFNDFYGHQKGDEVISSVARTVKNAIRHMDFVARYGGEEFVVLLPETDAHGAYAVASNIHKSIARLAIPHERSSVEDHVTISLGITVYRGEKDVSKEGLLKIADQALYRAKQLGRNQIYYQSLQNDNVA